MSPLTNLSIESLPLLRSLSSNAQIGNLIGIRNLSAFAATSTKSPAIDTSSPPVPSLRLEAPVQGLQVFNEPLLDYLPGSPERKLLRETLDRYRKTVTEVPIVINGRELWTDKVQYQYCPFEHRQKLAKFSYASPTLIEKAIQGAMEAKRKWVRIPAAEKIRLFIAAADLVAGKYRQELNAATMLGQAKTVFQAEIDAAAEFADFLRFNALYMNDLLEGWQPRSPEPHATRNAIRYRPLDGFVAAVSPFNFTAIGGNLATAPTMMGNVVLWKPSDAATLAGHVIMKVLAEAGFPPGVIQFLPSKGIQFGDTVTASPKLAGINFTGSVATFQHLWGQVASRLSEYETFPRLVGECGGKNFHLIHRSADLDVAIAATLRGAFEFSGQKCSATSRLYVPRSVWDTGHFQKRLIDGATSLRLGSPLEFDTFLSAVIDRKAFDRISAYLEYARRSENAQILCGGRVNDTKGYFVEPTVILSRDPHDRLMREEIFGPVLTVYPYEDRADEYCEAVMELISTTTPYALTGSIFAKDQDFIQLALDRLRRAAGNMYINDKSTGAVVGQQPFGGARLSGTNDKAGGPQYLLRWASPQTVKESFPSTSAATSRPPQVNYPYMASRD